MANLIKTVSLSVGPGVNVVVDRRTGDTSKNLYITVNKTTDLVVKVVDVPGTIDPIPVPIPEPIPVPAPTPDPVPVPVPEPVPPPAPVPPPVAPPGLTAKAMNMAAMVVFHSYNDSDGYERFQNYTPLEGPTARLTFHALGLGIGEHAFLGTKYTLLIDDVPVQTVDVVPGAGRSEFNINTVGIPIGWHKFDIESNALAETSPSWYMHIGADPKLGDYVPVSTGSYDLLKFNNNHFHGKLPTTSPKAYPLPPRECPEFSTPLAAKNLVRENIIPQRRGNMHRPTKNEKGVVTTFNLQAYFFWQLTSKYPTMPLLDGPRNVGNLAMPTALSITRQGGTYGADSWRVYRTGTDGTITTRCGYKHVDGKLTLVGDWSAVPEARRGFHEIWAIPFDKRSLVLDPSAAPIGGEQPHIKGPRQFVIDTQNNRVCLLQYNANNHDEPKVFEFITGLNDPWSGVCEDGILYLSERGAHRISAYDATTGVFIETIVSGAPLAALDHERVARAIVPLAQVQAEDCVSPEDLGFMDGWLHFGSHAMQQIKKINIKTREIKYVGKPRIDDNSKFVKISISDGTFGPRGTVFPSTWSNGSLGFPDAILPDGTGWAYHADGQALRGRGPGWAAAGYTSASAVGMGRLVFGSSEEGLVQISQALPTDPAIDEKKYEAGQAQYLAGGYNVLHGWGGFGYHGYAPPFGISPELDYYLTWNGVTA